MPPVWCFAVDFRTKVFSFADPIPALFEQFGSNLIHDLLEAVWSVSDEYSLLVDIDLDAAASLQPNSFSEMFQRTGPDKGIRIGHQTFSMLRQNAPLDSLSMTARFVSNRAFFPGNIYVFHAVTSPA